MKVRLPALNRALRSGLRLGEKRGDDRGDEVHPDAGADAVEDVGGGRGGERDGNASVAEQQDGDALGAGGEQDEQAEHERVDPSYVGAERSSEERRSPEEDDPCDEQVRAPLRLHRSPDPLVDLYSPSLIAMSDCGYSQVGFELEVVVGLVPPSLASVAVGTAVVMIAITATSEKTKPRIFRAT